MDENLIQQLINEARQDNEAAREKLILSFRNNIAAASSRVCGRTLDWNNDDELSIGLIAFNEAIDSFDVSQGKSFWNYAQLVIRNRLIDHFRRESSWKLHVVPPTINDEGTDQLDNSQAIENYQNFEAAKDRAEMVAYFQSLLLKYRITLNDLIKDSPKHSDTRASLMKAAVTLMENPELLQKLLITKQLPIKELILLTRLSRKVLETGRRYIIALVLILSNNELSSIKGLIKFNQEGR